MPNVLLCQLFPQGTSVLTVSVWLLWLCAHFPSRSVTPHPSVSAVSLFQCTLSLWAHSLCSTMRIVPWQQPFVCAHCSSIPTFPVCPLPPCVNYICDHLSFVSTVPTVPLYVPGPLFLCARCPSAATVPLFHCSSVLSEGSFTASTSFVTIPY